MKNYLAVETSQGVAGGLADQGADPQDRLRDLRAGDLLGDPVLAGGLGTVKPKEAMRTLSLTYNNQTTQLNKTSNTTSQYVITTRIPVYRCINLSIKAIAN